MHTDAEQLAARVHQPLQHALFPHAGHPAHIGAQHPPRGQAGQQHAGTQDVELGEQSVIRARAMLRQPGHGLHQGRLPGDDGSGKRRAEEKRTGHGGYRADGELANAMRRHDQEAKHGRDRSRNAIRHRDLQGGQAAQAGRAGFHFGVAPEKCVQDGASCRDGKKARASGQRRKHDYRMCVTTRGFCP
ncbi:hypothetical protein D3C71_1517840 [compost metagenome]